MIFLIKIMKNLFISKGRWFSLEWRRKFTIKTRRKFVIKYNADVVLEALKEYNRFGN